MLEGLSWEIRRRNSVVTIFPYKVSSLMLISATQNAEHRQGML